MELSPEGVPEEPAIGVVVSLTSAPGEGAQWNQAAEGAQVAAYRYGLGDVDVTIVPRDDHGTAKGAEQAVRELADEGVSRHRAWPPRASHVPARSTPPPRPAYPCCCRTAARRRCRDGVWATGAEPEQVAAALAAALDAAGASQPGAGRRGGRATCTGLPTDTHDPVRPGGANAELARRTPPGAARAPTAVVVSGPARAPGADGRRRCSSATSTLPVFLSGDAVSPAFAERARTRPAAR